MIFLTHGPLFFYKKSTHLFLYSLFSVNYIQEYNLLQVTMEKWQITKYKLKNYYYELRIFSLNLAQNSVDFGIVDAGVAM